MSAIGPEEFQEPDEHLVYEDISDDGVARLTVHKDSEPETFILQHFGGMGCLRVQNTSSGEVYHEERLALSPEAIFGPGPTDNEIERWWNILKFHIDE